MEIVNTDVLVVGAGPAGLTLAAFLARQGVKAITVTKYPGTADSPRAHITNQRAVEVFRDLGIETEVMAAAMPQEQMGTQVFATSFAGTEICRKMTWGAGVDRHAEYEAASPSKMCNAPQHVLEPLLLAAGKKYNADIRFGTECIRIEQDANAVHAVVRERGTNKEYGIQAKYVVGCDGARSTVGEQLGFEFEGQMGLGDAYTVWLEADLTRYTRHRSGALFMVCEPGSDIWLSAWTCVKPWTEWNPLFLRHQRDKADLSEEAVLKRVRSAIGDPSIDVKIKKISAWQINHCVAAQYRKGRAFLAGDAAHRHPPSGGLGSNTCVQDSYNLAWKFALVLSGKAGEALLDTYHAERKPVGRHVVDRANKSIADMGPWSQAVGLGPDQTAEEAWSNIKGLMSDSEEGARRREAMLAGIDGMEWQFNAIGVELGQRYESSAIVSDGTAFPPYTRDQELHYHSTTHPGAYLPHAWLEKDKQQISTIDLAGKDGFALITGIGGQAWLDAAATVGRELGVKLTGYAVGLRQPYDDTLGVWTRKREVRDHGCILVRPDGYVAWRSHNGVADATAALRDVMRKVLAR